MPFSPPLNFQTNDAACHTLRVWAEYIRRGEYEVSNIAVESIAGDQYTSIVIKKRAGGNGRI